jgi:pyruvate kinase
MPTDSFKILNGRVIRYEGKRQALARTAIVASIGKPEHYPERILDIDGNEIDGGGSIDYRFLVRRFFESGVDLIRLNLSHLSINELRTHFPVIKDELLKCEGSGEGRKRIAVLADLPGPKIRFHLKPDTKLTVNQEFTVHFTEQVPTENSATVYIGDDPLKLALELLDKQTESLDIHPDDDHDEGRQLYENTLGGTLRDFGDGGSFENLLDVIDSAANSDAGLRVVIGDGEVELKALRNGLDRKAASLQCKVVSVHSQKLKPKAGFTLRGVNIDIPSFTDDDQQILKTLLELDYATSGSNLVEPVIAFIAISFAQTAHDISLTKKYVEDCLRRLLKGVAEEEVSQRVPSLIAKIETEKGYENRKYILDVADGIMVARGDLGLQMKIEKVPAAQKRLIQLCNKRGKPVITATQLLKSMTTTLEPTRAEATDVFNAVNDGSDAVMMSEETSTGRHPFQAIKKMISIGIEAERYHEYRGIKDVGLRRAKVLARIEGFLRDNLDSIRKNEERFKRILALLERETAKLKTRVDEKSQQRLGVLRWQQEMYSDKWNKTMNQLNTDLITEAACKMSAREGIRCIIAASTSGRTVRMISRLRPGVTIAGAAHDPINTRKLNLSYGTLPVCIPLVSEERGTEGVFEDAEEVIRKDPFLSLHLLTSDSVPVVFTAGMPLRRPGTTNLIQVRELRRVAKQKQTATGSLSVW